MSFSQVQDQGVATRLLRNIIVRDRVPHGLLFYGPAGVGKYTTALELAKAINCQESADDACDHCLSCRKTAAGNHPDVKVITPTGRARNINVETVDFMNELATYRPFEGRWRIFIIEDIDRMREPAQNHMLKTLEEPPSNTLFILLTEFPRRLLPTIRSRCQQVRFGALRPETVTTLLLRHRDIPAEVAPAIAAVSQGQMSRALNLVDTDKRDIVLDLTRRLGLGEDPLLLSEEFVGHLRAQSEAIKAAAKAEAEQSDPQDGTREDREEQKQEAAAFVESLIRRDLMEYLYLLEAWYRDELVFTATGSARSVLNRDQTQRLEQIRPADHAKKISAIERAWLYIERNLSMDRVFRDLFFALAS
jgi:DNA polymerase-3 subunit delta'